MTVIAEVGQWVQIENTVLPPGSRAPGVPEDTQNLPLIMRVKGFALSEASIGDQVTVETVIGRQVSGKLIAINPSYDHNFGRPVPELLPIASEVREQLAKRGGAK